MKVSEDKIQTECYIWFHNNHPELRGLLCYNLNNSKHAKAGAVNKAMGLQKGRADMVFYYRGKAIMIEFKTPDGTQQKCQKEWQKQIESQGFEYKIVRSLGEFKTLFSFILNE